MDLVRDVMDKALIDREECEMGRVDGLVMELGEHSQPRITDIEIGGSALWSRLHPALTRFAAKVARKWGPKRTASVRIPWSRVVTAGKDIKLDVEAKETGAIDWEIWVARHVIERIPGGGHEEEE